MSSAGREIPRLPPYYFAVALVPIVAFLLLRQLGLLELARLGLLAGVGFVAALALLTHPRFGVYFMMVYIFAGLSMYLPQPTVAAIMLTITFAAVLEILRGEPVWLRDPAFAVALAVFVLYALSSVMWGIEPGRSLVVFIRLLKAALVVVLIVQLVRTERQLRWLARWIFAGGVLTVVLGLINLRLGISAAAEDVRGLDLVRFMGAHANANGAAAFMLTTIPMGVFMARSAARKLERTVAIVGVVVLMFAVFATYSRGALPAFALLILMVMFREARGPRSWTLILSVLILGLAFMPAFFWERLSTLGDVFEEYGTGYSVVLRLRAGKAAWNSFLGHPAFGVGLANFDIYPGHYIWKPLGPHNAYLHILATLGCIGLVTYLSVVYTAARHLFAGAIHRWGTEADWMRHLSYYFLVSVAVSLTVALFGDFELDYLMWIPLGGGLVVGNLMRAKQVFTDDDHA